MNINGRINLHSSFRNLLVHLFAFAVSLLLILPFVSSGLVVTGAGPGEGNGAHVKVWNYADGKATEVLGFIAYSSGVAWGAKVALGDVDGDGEKEVITGAGSGAGNGAHVKVWSVKGGKAVEKAGFIAYDTLFGANVAAGDVDGDGRDEVITGAGPSSGNGAHVKVWDVEGGKASEKLGFIAYSSGVTWGANVAAGDVDGDGKDEVITGAGPSEGNGAHVKVWDVEGGKASEKLGFIAYSSGVAWGANVAAGDVDGDGKDEVITGAGPGEGNGAHVKAWAIAEGKAEELFGFIAYDALWGVNVAAGDLDEDGVSEIITGAGPGSGNGAHVKVWKFANGKVVSPAGFMAYGALSGANVGASSGHGFNGFGTFLMKIGDTATIRGFRYVLRDLNPESATFEVKKEDKTICAAYGAPCNYAPNSQSIQNTALENTTNVRVKLFGITTEKGVSKAIVYFSPAKKISIPPIILPSGCIDSDGGLNYYLKGTADNGAFRSTDECITNSTLREFYCSKISVKNTTGMNVSLEYFKCQFGCENGACKKPACNTYSSCGSGNIPSECEAAGAEIVQSPCGEAVNATILTCREKWNTACLWFGDSKLDCPGGVRDKLVRCGKFGKLYLKYRAFCHKDADTECSKSPSCGSKAKPVARKPCSIATNATAYCCFIPTVFGQVDISTVKDSYAIGEEVKLQ